MPSAYYFFVVRSGRKTDWRLAAPKTMSLLEFLFPRPMGKGCMNLHYEILLSYKTGQQCWLDAL